MKITKDMLIGDVLDQYPDLAVYFFEIGMHCLGCPHSRGSLRRARDRRRRPAGEAERGGRLRGGTYIWPARKGIK